MLLDAEPAVNSKAPPQEPPAQRSSAPAWTLCIFLGLWAACYATFRALPYLRSGSDIVFTAKLRLENDGVVFPAGFKGTRLLIFGNSKILSGFLPSRFDQLSAAEHVPVSSFNSGFPGSDLFLPPLQAMCARGQAPDVLLLTLPWNSDPPARSVFRFLPDDHAALLAFFPFRNLLRDLSAFLINAQRRGGLRRYYRESEEYERSVISHRGYYLIKEQSHSPGDRLPDDFHLVSDEPTQTLARSAPGVSAQSIELTRLIGKYHIRCYYVPFYLREGEAAPAPPNDQRFAAQVAEATPCRLLGPDYYLYPNRLFADQTHLNEAGARAYTEALFGLLKESRVALQ